MEYPIGTRIVNSKNNNNDKNVKFLLAAVNGLVSGIQLNFKLYYNI